MRQTSAAAVLCRRTLASLAKLLFDQGHEHKLSFVGGSHLAALAFLSRKIADLIQSQDRHELRRRLSEFNFLQ